jgi:hypothetical protein
MAVDATSGGQARPVAGRFIIKPDIYLALALSARRRPVDVPARAAQSHCCTTHQRPLA